MIYDPRDDVTEREVIALDLALDAVARREHGDTDHVLAALASFAEEIDGRAAALTPRRRLPALRPSHRGSPDTDGRDRSAASPATQAPCRPRQPTR